MKSRHKYILASCFLALGLILNFSNLFSQQTAGELFEKALYVEEAQGDLEKAIGLYQQILKKFSENREVCAKAQLKIGQCYEKLGNTEAVKAYELVLKNFADRPDEVAVARERLAALRQEEGGGIIKKNLPISEIEFQPYVLSPDGTKILGISSDEGDNIAVLDIATDRTELLTHFDYSLDTPWADAPVWSPDGKEIAYTQALYRKYLEGPVELRAMTLDGESRLLYACEDGIIWPCDWLYDGSGLVVIRVQKDGSYILGLVTLPDRTFKPLCPIPWQGKGAAYASASPDGRYIAFNDNKMGHRDIHIFSFDRRETHVVVEHPANDTSPLWSPDGKYLVFLSNRHGRSAVWGLEMTEGRAAGAPFMIKEAQLGSMLNWTSQGLAFYEYIEFNDILIQAFDPQLREVVGKPQDFSYTPPGVNFSPCWSPDGKLLAFFSRTNEEPAQLKVVIKPVGGGDARVLPVPPPAVISQNQPASTVYSLSWFRDGSGIWSAAWTENYERVLMGLDLATGSWTSQKLPDDSLHSIVLSRDGKSIFYTKMPSQGKLLRITEYYLETGKDKEIYRLEKPGDLDGLCFSPDYRSLAFLQTEYGEKGENPIQLLQVIDMESGKVRTAYAGPVFVGRPVFSPDGRDLLVYFKDESGWQKGVGLIPAAGGDLRKLKLELSWPRGADLNNRFISLDWSPDGKQIALTSWSIKEEMYVLKNVIPKDRR